MFQVVLVLFWVGYGWENLGSGGVFHFVEGFGSRLETLQTTEYMFKIHFSKSDFGTALVKHEKAMSGKNTRSSNTPQIAVPHGFLIISGKGQPPSNPLGSDIHIYIYTY